MRDNICAAVHHIPNFVVWLLMLKLARGNLHPGCMHASLDDLRIWFGKQLCTVY